MRLLKFNNNLVNIDEATAIGITFQAYDVTDPANRKFSVSNNFSIPKTVRNMNLIGHAGNIQFASTTVYDAIECSYFIDSFRLINQGRVIVTSISNNRINCSLKERPEFWETLTTIKWGEFQQNFLTWLQAEKGYPSATSIFSGTFNDFISGYVNNTEGLILPLYMSNLAQYPNPALPSQFLEDIDNVWLKYSSGTSFAQGGHFAAFSKSIFEYIEYLFGINLGALESFAYNIFEDAIGSTMYTPLRNIAVKHEVGGFYFKYYPQPIEPYKNTVGQADKTVYDYVKAFFQVLNCVIDKDNLIDENPLYKIRRFDDIINAEIVEFSDNYEDDTKEFFPQINGYKQNNYIKFSKVFNAGDILLNSKTITSNNKNIEAGNTDESLFTIEGYVNSLLYGVANLSDAESLETFSFFVSNGTYSTDVISNENGVTETSTQTLQVAEMYSIASEYNTIDSIITYPVRWTIDKWLSLNDIASLQFFKLYKIRELNGYFFLNKINGFNPDKSTKATKLEFIKIQ